MINLLGSATLSDTFTTSEVVKWQIDYRPVETDGAARAAALLAEML